MEDTGEQMLYNCHLARVKATLSYGTRLNLTVVVMVDKLKI